jgi:hypothetical protein
MPQEGDESGMQEGTQDQGATEETSAQQPSQEWVEPNPADYGVVLGTNPCIDECWRRFYQCLQTVPDRKSCEDQLAKCLKEECGGADAGAGDAGTM